MSAVQVWTVSIPIDGTEMDCVRFGEGERTLLLLPGLGLRALRESGRAMAYTYRLLAQTYQVCILDCKREVPEGYTMRALAADAGRALDALGVRRADVFGISMGGMIAQYLALDRSELVEKLVLAVTLSRPNGTMRSAARRWMELAERGDYEALVSDVMASTYSEDFLQRFGRLFPMAGRPVAAAELERFRALTGACLSCDTYDRLEELHCPALVIGGRRDRVVTGRASEEMAERLGCALYMYDELGHSVCEEAHDLPARVLAFLQS